MPTLFILGDQDELTLPSLVHDTAAVGGWKPVQIPSVGQRALGRTGVCNAVPMAFLDNLSRRNHAGATIK